MQNYNNNEAVERYKKKMGYRQLKIETKAQYVDGIKKFCQDMGVSYTEFIVKSCNYFIQRGELPPE